MAHEFLDAATTDPFMRTAFGDVFCCCRKLPGFVSVSVGANSHLDLNFYLKVGLTESDVLQDLYLGGEINSEHAHVTDLRTHLAFLAEFIEQVRPPIDTYLEMFGP